jgi:glutathione S-transferase
MESALNAIKKLSVTLKRLDAELEGRNYLSGNGNIFGMADLAAAPFVMRAFDAKAIGWFDLFQNLEEAAQLSPALPVRAISEISTKAINSIGGESKVLSNFQRWATLINERPSTRSSIPEHYKQVEMNGLKAGKSVWVL